VKKTSSHATVETAAMKADEIPAGVTITYSRQYRRCGKSGCTTCAGGAPGHGPYWYGYWRADGRPYKRYVGRTLPPGVSINGEAPPGEAGNRAAGAEAPQSALPAPDRAPLGPPKLRVRTLGGFVVWRGGEEAPAKLWRRRSAGALFKILLGSPNFTLTRDRATDFLWPEAEPETTARNLHGTLFALRAILDTTGARISLEGDVLRLAAPEDDEWLDVRAFESAARAALAGRDVETGRRALARYGGEYLPDDLYAEWAVGRREVLRTLHVALLLHLATLCGAQGDLREAEEHLRAVVRMRRRN
jgi:hypothetical protein